MELRTDSSTGTEDVPRRRWLWTGERHECFMLTHADFLAWAARGVQWRWTNGLPPMREDNEDKPLWRSVEGPSEGTRRSMVLHLSPSAAALLH